MRTVKSGIWTWLLPQRPRKVDWAMWRGHGGKWIVFDDRERITALAEALGPYIDSGKIESAKYWNGDPSAVNVYSLDRDRMKVREILKGAGARYVLVWEYDYAWIRNLLRPATFTYSWYSKFRTILQSYGVGGAFRLAREALIPARAQGDSGAEDEKTGTPDEGAAGGAKRDHL